MANDAGVTGASVRLMLIESNGADKPPGFKRSGFAFRLFPEDLRDDENDDGAEKSAAEEKIEERPASGGCRHKECEGKIHGIEVWG
jgi:hypothetical protein